jgi:hypothetical protein
MDDVFRALTLGEPHERRHDRRAARIRRVLRHPRRHRLHRDLPGAGGALTFTLGGFFTRGQADLIPFFSFVPWLFLFLVPALTMRLWAEERRLGTIELLLTLPITAAQAVVGKIPGRLGLLRRGAGPDLPALDHDQRAGQPDNGVVLTGYLGCLLVAGAYLAIGAAISALTRNQVIAFVLAVAACFLFAAAGSPVVTEFLSANLPWSWRTSRAASRSTSASPASPAASSRRATSSSSPASSPSGSS